MSTQALVCQPRIYTGEVEALLLSLENRIDRATIQEYSLNRKILLHSDLGEAFSQLIDDMSPDQMGRKTNKGYFTGTPVFDPYAFVFPYFAGDLLSLMAHDQISAESKRSLTSTLLQTPVIGFSTVVFASCVTRKFIAETDSR